MGAVFRKTLILVISAFLIILGGVLTSCTALGFSKPPAPTETPTPVPTEPGTIPVKLLGENGKLLTDGVIRLTGTDLSDDIDNNGYFVAPCTDTQLIIAWAEGYKTSFVRCVAGAASYDISLVKLNTNDNPNYMWAAAGVETDPEASPNCARCHAGQRDTSHNEFSEWRQSGHAKVIFNRYFETVYLGANLNGNRGQSTQWDIIDSHLVQRAPVIDASYRGPGYKLDYPSKYGNCAYCHVPAAVGAAQTDVNLAQYFPNPGGSIGEGVTCDVCHKVAGIQLDGNGFPYLERPGILSFQFLRNNDINDRLYTGPLSSFVNVNSPSHSSTCSSVFSKSEFCAACHYGKFSGMLIYGSYSEWRESEYGRDLKSTSFKTCQDCHMARTQEAQGGAVETRDACSASNVNNHDYDHNMLDFGKDEKTGREIPLMIKDAAVVNADFAYDPAKKNWLTVTAKVRSKGVGHRFPTDSPLRHLILVVEVRDQRGTLLSQVDGDRVPSWGGAGDIAFQDPNIKLYAGKPGKIFANLLVEQDTNISPTIAYWNETKYAWVGVLSENPYDYSDTRLVPGIVDNSKYSFDVPETGDVTVTIRLIYRFAFYDIVRQKGWWNRPDIEVTSKEWLCVRRADPAGFDCKAKE